MSDPTIQEPSDDNPAGIAAEFPLLAQVCRSVLSDVRLQAVPPSPGHAEITVQIHGDLSAAVHQVLSELLDGYVRPEARREVLSTLTQSIALHGFMDRTRHEQHVFHNTDVIGATRRLMHFITTRMRSLLTSFFPKVGKRRLEQGQTDATINAIRFTLLRALAEGITSMERGR